MTELDPNIVLKAFATPQLDYADTLQKRGQIQRQQMLQQRDDAQYAAQQAAAARQAQVGSMASAGNYEDADKAALAAGDFDLHNHVASLQDQHRAQARSRINAAVPVAVQALTSTKDPAQRAQMIQSATPSLLAAGWKPEEISAFVSDPSKLNDAGLQGFIANARTAESALTQYDKQTEIKGYAAGTHLFQGANEVGSVPDKPDVQIVEGEDGFYSVNKRTSGASKVMVGGGVPGGVGAVGGGAVGARVAPPANLIQTATGGKGTISSGFGPRAAPSPGASTFHNGVDIALPAGSPVSAAANGTVIAAWNDTKNGGGLSVRIRHPDGSVTGYADLGNYNVKVGDQVRAGQPIGTAGSSGSTSTGPHLHLSYVAPGGAPAAGGTQLKGKPKVDPNSILPAPTLTLMADQYLAGDKSVLQNLGRGQQGAQNIVLLRGEISRQAQQRVMKGADIARVTAQFNGMNAEARTVGNIGGKVDYGANELTQAIPLAQQASAALPRGQFVPFNKAQQMVQSGTSNPQLKQFAVYTNAVINAYNLVAARSGTSTAEREHNATLLRTADSPEAYNAALEAMGMEAKVARSASRTTMDGIGGGRGGGDNIPTLTPQQAQSAPKGTRFRTTDGRVLVRQ